jgi:hypothetical protein
MVFFFKSILHSDLFVIALKRFAQLGDLFNSQTRYLSDLLICHQVCFNQIDGNGFFA